MTEENDKLAAPTQDNADKPVVGGTDGTESTPPVAPKGDEALKDTATKTPSEPAGFNAETSYKDLQERYGKLDKSYSEIRRAYTQSSQRAAEYEKKLDQMMKMLSKATETPIDPQQFIRDVQSRGHEPIVELINREKQKLQADFEDQYGKVLKENQSYIASLEARFLKEQMRNDEANFPGFKDLEPVMADLVEDPNLPIDPNAPVNEQMKALYKLARARSADDAILKAHEEGARAKEKELAKEASTAVAGGGRTAGTTVPDWSKLSPEEHRKKLIELYGIAER